MERGNALTRYEIRDYLKREARSEKREARSEKRENNLRFVLGLPMTLFGGMGRWQASLSKKNHQTKAY
ncbi:hypothetical protein FCV83_17095 [Enterovibrio norvegicus]|nr:hypothetical protein FCV83_17095 [Enterovibrio norvegicus]